MTTAVIGPRRRKKTVAEFEYYIFTDYYYDFQKAVLFESVSAKLRNTNRVRSTLFGIIRDGESWRIKDLS